MNNEQTLNWVRGLSEYLNFVNDQESKKIIDFLEQAMYADNPVIDTTNQQGMVEFISVLRKFATNPIFDIFHKYYRAGYDPLALQDAFSRGQVLSKIWLVEELKKIKSNFEMIHVHAGWFGQHRLYIESAGIRFNKMRVFDSDETACNVSDTIFNNDYIEDYRVKATPVSLPLREDQEHKKNMDWVTRTGIEYEVKNFSKENSYTEKTVPDLIINSSAEHMSSVWYHKFVNRPIETDPLFIIQTNNLFDIAEHQLCVHSLDHMQKKFPMSRLEYAGEKELYGYKRFMMIGRP